MPSFPCINVRDFFPDGESQTWKIYDVGGSRTQVLCLFSLRSRSLFLIDYVFTAQRVVAIL